MINGQFSIGQFGNIDDGKEVCTYRRQRDLGQLSPEMESCRLSWNCVRTTRANGDQGRHKSRQSLRTWALEPTVEDTTANPVTKDTHTNTKSETIMARLLHGLTEWDVEMIKDWRTSSGACDSLETAYFRTVGWVKLGPSSSSASSGSIGAQRFIKSTAWRTSDVVVHVTHFKNLIKA